ncbi:MAG: hypothetical protein JWQ49_4556 [Edaphobacter sp.]|nr:hypothetical protein [Edaphobacter sp.]
MRKSSHRPIIASEVIHGFEVIGRAKSKPGKRMVDFKCSACKDGIGTTRFSVLCAGKVVKSCRCKRDAAYNANQNSFAAALTKSQVRDRRDRREVSTRSPFRLDSSEWRNTPRTHNSAQSL